MDNNTNDDLRKYAPFLGSGDYDVIRYLGASGNYRYLNLMTPSSPIVAAQGLIDAPIPKEENDPIISITSNATVGWFVRIKRVLNTLSVKHNVEIINYRFKIGFLTLKIEYEIIGKTSNIYKFYREIRERNKA